MRNNTSTVFIFSHCRAHTQTYQTVLFPGLREFGPLLLSGYKDLHILKCGVVPCLRLEGHLVLWRRLS